MKRNWLIGAAVFLTLILAGLIVKTKFLNQSAVGALSVSTTPKATVFLNEAQLGTTPFSDNKIEVGEHRLRLVPEDQALSAWESQITIQSGALTVIKWNFAATESASSGEAVWLEEMADKEEVALAVVSLPDQAVVKINGQPRGFAPLLLEDLTVGEYQVIIDSLGYEERLITAKTVAGRKLIINVQLAQQVENIQIDSEADLTPTPEAEVTPTPNSDTPTPSPKLTPRPTQEGDSLARPYVKIKETGTGWLNVRVTPGGSKIARVDVGQTFPYLNEKKSGWLKIEYEPGKEGWVSGAYVDLFE